jgi:hypothetical protein
MDLNYLSNQIAFLFKTKHMAINVAGVSVLYSEQFGTSESIVGVGKY